MTNGKNTGKKSVAQKQTSTANKTPSLSVLVAVYNVEEYLNECLHSLEIQTLQDVEFVVVDDGSSDGSAAICDGFASRDPRFKVINHEKNLGTLLARKTLVDAMSGEYCTFLDGDDMLADENTCQKMLDLAYQTGADITQFDMKCFGPDGRHVSQMNDIFHQKTFCGKIEGSKEIVSACFSDDNKFYWNMAGKVFKSKILKKANEYLKNDFLINCEDFYQFFTAAFFSETYEKINGKEFYLYRISSGISTSNGLSDDKKMFLLRNFVKIPMWIREFLDKNENCLTEYTSVFKWVKEYFSKTTYPLFEALSLNIQSEFFFDMIKTIDPDILFDCYRVQIDVKLVEIAQLQSEISALQSEVSSRTMKAGRLVCLPFKALRKAVRRIESNKLDRILMKPFRLVYRALYAAARLAYRAAGKICGNARGNSKRQRGEE